MSRKGYAPWQDDIAADSLSEVMEKTQFAQEIRRMLKQPVDDVSAHEIRAAAGILLAIGYVYIWPINEINSDFELAARQLEKCIPFEESEQLRELMSYEVKLLRARVGKMLQKDKRPQIADLWLRWLAEPKEEKTGRNV